MASTSSANVSENVVGEVEETSAGTLYDICVNYVGEFFKCKSIRGILLRKVYDDVHSACKEIREIKEYYRRKEYCEHLEYEFLTHEFSHELYNFSRNLYDQLLIADKMYEDFSPARLIVQYFPEWIKMTEVY